MFKKILLVAAACVAFNANAYLCTLEIKDNQEDQEITINVNQLEYIMISKNNKIYFQFQSRSLMENFKTSDQAKAAYDRYTKIINKCLNR